MSFSFCCVVFGWHFPARLACMRVEHRSPSPCLHAPLQSQFTPFHLSVSTVHVLSASPTLWLTCFDSNLSSSPMGWWSALSSTVYPPPPFLSPSFPNPASVQSPSHRRGHFASFSRPFYFVSLIMKFPQILFVSLFFSSRIRSLPSSMAVAHVRAATMEDVLESKDFHFAREVGARSTSRRVEGT